MALVLDFCSLFSRALSIVLTQIFKAYLHPEKQADLSEALLLMLYGGRDAYSHRNELYKLAKASKVKDFANVDLSLPEWERFLHLARQLLDAPVDVQRVPLILREVGFSFLRTSNDFAFARSLCSETPQGARFALLIADYLCKAAKLPSEFAKVIDQALLPLQPIK